MDQCCDDMIKNFCILIGRKLDLDIQMLQLCQSAFAAQSGQFTCTDFSSQSQSLQLTCDHGKVIDTTIAIVGADASVEKWNDC